jgi:putative phage-type endonuclease
VIIVNIPQGSDEWLTERAGKVTASCFGKILTATGSRTTGETRTKYLYQLVGERISGQPEETFKNEWMQRGNDLEPDAREKFEDLTGDAVDEVGVIYLDHRLFISASPDGLIGDSSGLELKCPKLSTHISYLDSGKLPAVYKQQVQGCMWVADRQSWNFMSYHPLVRPFLMTIERDDKYIRILAEAVEEFNHEVETLVEKIGGRA